MKKIDKMNKDAMSLAVGIYNQVCNYASIPDPETAELLTLWYAEMEYEATTQFDHVARDERLELQRRLREIDDFWIDYKRENLSLDDAYHRFIVRGETGECEVIMAYTKEYTRFAVVTFGNPDGPNVVYDSLSMFEYRVAAALVAMLKAIEYSGSPVSPIPNLGDVAQELGR